MVFEEYGHSDEVLKNVSQFVRGTALEIQVTNIVGITIITKAGLMSV